jgi:putative endonuclease
LRRGDPRHIVIAGLDPAIQMATQQTMSTYYVYILASQRNGTLYGGVTSDLAARIRQHRDAAVAGFTKRYGVSRLVHVEPFEDVRDAIQREKTLKKWKRVWKLALVERDNPTWRDLCDDLPL